jgi:hypothetical protein
MIFPGAFYVTGTIYSAIFGLIVSFFVALKGKSLTIVALIASLSALVVDLLLLFLM